MGRLKKCLVCYSTPKSNEKFTNFQSGSNIFGNTGILADEVSVIFFVRKLLKVPKSVCDRLLEEIGSPSGWGLTFCAVCQELLNDAKEVAKVIYNLEEKLIGLENKIISQITVSYTDAGEPPRRNYHKELEALDEIRYCVAKGLFNHDYDTKSKELEDEQFDDVQDYDQDYDHEDEEFDTQSNGGRSPLENKKPSRRSHRICLKTKTKTVPPPKGKKVKIKIEIKPELFKTLVPPVVPLNGNFTNETETQPFNNDDDESNSVSSDPLQLPDDICNSSADPNKQRQQQSKELLNDNANFGDKSVSCSDGDNSVNSITHDQRKESSAEDLSQEVKTNCWDIEAEKYLQAVTSARFRSGVAPNGQRRQKRYTDEERPFKCSLCRRKYTTDFLLQVHINRVHKGLKKQFICKLCPRSFRRRTLLEKHLLQVHVYKSKILKMFSCTQCRAQFTTEMRLEIHTQKLHLGNDKPLACQLCDRKFGQLCRLEKHLQDAHEMTVKSNDGYLYERKADDKINAEKIVKKFKCPKCVHRFETEDIRFSHVQRRHNGIQLPYKCNICSKGFIRKSVLDDHLLSHERKARKDEDKICPEANCRKKFALPCLLRAHIRVVHENQRDFICEICSKLYKTKRALQGHQAAQHSNAEGVKTIPCEQCDKHFGTLGALKTHVDRIHKNIYRFYCAHCTKGFSVESKKQEHENTHTGAKSYVCETCGRGFAQQCSLVVHRRQHTGEKPFHCDTCGQDFAERTWFKRHQELHTGIIHHCPICGKGFPIKHNLGIHMKSHANKNGTNNKRMANAKVVKEKQSDNTREKRNRKKPQRYESESDYSSDME